MVCCFDKTCSTTLVVGLTAFLCTQLVAAGSQTRNFSSPVPGDCHMKNQFDRRSSNESIMKIPEMQALIRKESGRNGLPVDCCPMTKELIEPLGGTNLHGMYVDLYRDGDKAQRFFEYSCRPDVLDKPCRFIDRKLQAQSRCVQKYSYTYAIVQTIQQKQQRQFPLFAGIGGMSSWTLDYISVRSGCGCELVPNPRKS